MSGEHQAPDFRIAEDARVATDLPIDQNRVMFAGRLAFMVEAFLLAHEIAHLLLGHDVRLAGGRVVGERVRAAGVVLRCHLPRWQSLCELVGK